MISGSGLCPKVRSGNRDVLHEKRGQKAKQGLGLATLFRKPADSEDGLVSQRSIQASFMLKGKGVWLVGADFLMLESFVLAAVRVGRGTMFL